MPLLGKGPRLKHMTIFSTEANTTNSAVLPVSYACAQPYYPSSGSDRQQEETSNLGLCHTDESVHSRRCQVDLAVRMSKVTGNTKEMVVFASALNLALKT